MSEINNAQLNDLVKQLVSSTDETERKRLTRTIFGLFIEHETFHRWAISLARKFSYRDVTGLADIEQVIAEKIVKVLGSATPERTERITDWMRFLFGNASNAVSDYLSSSEVTFSSRMSGVILRRRIIHRTEAELSVKWGRKPTQQEIIDVANASSLARNSNARKQGLLLSEKDFAAALADPSSLDDDPAGAMAAHTDDVETKSEASLALRRLGAAAAELFPGDQVLYDVIGAWTTAIVERERPNMALIERMTGHTKTEVRSAMARLNDVLERVREDYAD